MAHINRKYKVSVRQHYTYAKTKYKDKDQKAKRQMKILT